MTKWKVTIDRQHPLQRDWRDTEVANRPGKIERVCADHVVSVFPWAMTEETAELQAIKNAERDFNLDVTMEPKGTSYVCAAVRITK